MFLAPTPTLSGTLLPMRSGVPGIWQTLRTMRRLVEQDKTDPAVIQGAISVSYLTPEKDQYSEAESIFNYVRDHVRYVRDVNGIETLTSPRMTMQRLVGDCDDQVMLLAALLESVGYVTRFVIAGYSDPRAFEHVYMQVLLNGEWVSADPTERVPLGWEPPGALIIDFERV